MLKIASLSKYFLYISFYGYVLLATFSSLTFFPFYLFIWTIVLAIHLLLQGGLVEVGETLIDMSWKQSKKIRKQKWKRKYSQNTQYLRENSKVLKHATPTKQSTVKLRFHFTCQIIRWCRKNEWQWRKTLAKINRMLRNNPLDKYILSSE